MADEPQPTYVTPLQAERRLTAYLSDASQLGILYPPQGLDPQDVIRILKDKVAEDATGEPLARMIRTVELYDLYEATDYLKSFLKRAERDADSWTRSTKVVAALARVARGDDWAVARDYYRYLTTKAQTYVRLASLLECLEALGPQEPPDALRQAAESRL
ncbi:MAG: hypothetical protein KKI02_10570, partial [Planctomycetes bacterium]|nr:hypothetical protein [Planctomycetota bacterium]